MTPSEGRGFVLIGDSLMFVGGAGVVAVELTLPSGFVLLTGEKYANRNKRSHNAASPTGA